MDTTGLIYVKAKEGRSVREPMSKLLMPAEGMWVSAHDVHWAQLINFGDIEITEEPPSEEEVAAAKKAADIATAEKADAAAAEAHAAIEGDVHQEQGA